MAKSAVGVITRLIRKKPTKSERNRPGRAKRKPYRGQGKP